MIIVVLLREVVSENVDSGTRRPRFVSDMAWVWTPVLPFTSSMTLDKLLALSVPICKMGTIIVPTS